MALAKHGFRREDGYPTCYKLDLANATCMVGVEIDGFSHSSLKQKALDRKKTQVLSDIGWTVLRFTNLEVTHSLASVVEKILSHCTISK